MLAALALETGIPVAAWEREPPGVIEHVLDLIKIRNSKK